MFPNKMVCQCNILLIQSTVWVICVECCGSVINIYTAWYFDYDSHWSQMIPNGDSMFNCPFQCSELCSICRGLYRILSFGFPQYGCTSNKDNNYCYWSTCHFIMSMISITKIEIFSSSTAGSGNFGSISSLK